MTKLCHTTTANNAEHHTFLSKKIVQVLSVVSPFINYRADLFKVLWFDSCEVLGLTSCNV